MIFWLFGSSYIPRYDVCARNRPGADRLRPKVPLIRPSQTEQALDQTQARSTVSMRWKCARIHL